MKIADYEINIVRSQRKTVAIQVRPDGTIEVRAPKNMSDAAVKSVAEQHLSWIEKKLRQVRAQTEEQKTQPALSKSEMNDLWDKAMATFPERVKYYAPLVGVRYGRITIRLQQSRFGSCSARGNLNFNVALMLAPPEVLDYVVVHELCHRLEMNHSERFWREVGRVMPGFDQHRRWLKEHGGALIRLCTAAR